MRSGSTIRRIVVSALVPIALFVSLAGWAVASPLAASPDDDYHLASIWCAQGERDGLCEPGDTAAERRVPSVMLHYIWCYAFDDEASADCEMTPPDVLESTTRGNFDASYPPVYYGAMSVFAGPDLVNSMLAIRIANAALFTIVVSGLFFLLRPGTRGPYLWGALATMVPLGMFLVPSVNPSSWTVMSALTLWVATLAYWDEESRPRLIAFGAIAVLMTVLASGARSDAAVYSALAVLIAGVLAYDGTPRFWQRAWLPGALIVLAAVFFLTSGQSSALSTPSVPDSRVAGGPLGLALANLVLLPQLWAGVFGVGFGLGWLDTLMPGLVWVPLIGLFFGLLFWGIQVMGRAKAIALGLVVASLIVVPLYILVKDGLVVGAGVQPRYIYPLMIMLAGFALVGFRRESLRLNRVHLWLVGSIVAIANAVALHTNLRRYITGVDVAGANLDAGIEWWWELPITPMAVWAVGSVAFAIAVAGIMTYLAAGRPAPSRTHSASSARATP